MSDDDDETIDPRLFIKQLDPDQLGMFEPLSGLMLLNVSDAGLIAMTERWTANRCSADDVSLLRTINHEAYHFAQCAASGYGFDRQRRAFAAFNAVDPAEEEAGDPSAAALASWLQAEAGDDPELNRRLERMLAMVAGHDRLAAMEAAAGPGDHSLAGALMPGFFRHQREVAEHEAAQGDEGLSIKGLIEGSAVVHSHLLMNPASDARPQIEAELATLPPVYHELWDMAVARVGARALDLILPAVALALNYAAPHAAFGPLLALIAASGPGSELATGRAVAARAPPIAGAGTFLGSAVEVRRADDSYRLYDRVIDDLSAPGAPVDAYALLAEPQAMHRLGGFQLGLVTADGYRAGTKRMDPPELVARMALMAAVLRVRSRRRQERAFRAFQLGWAQEVIGRLADGKAPPQD